MSAKVEAFLQFLKAARSLADQGMSKEAIMQFAENQFGKISKDGLFYKQIQNIFKPKEGIEKIKIKDEVFDDTVVKLPIDDTGQPFNPKDPLKQYGKPKKLTYEEAVAQEEAKAAADEDYIMKIIDPEDFATGGRAGYYTGGMIDVEPNLSDIGHGSDSLMARTRLVSPNSQATTSTGLNYLLAEDNDNIRVPFSKGKLVLKKLDEGRRNFMKTAAAGAAGLAALKTGFLGLGKEAAPVVEKAVEAAKSVPPYFFQLMDVIKSKGQEIKSYGERIKQTIAPSKDGKSELMLTEDLNTGDIQIKKIYKEGDNMVTKSEEMNFNKGRADEGTKGTPADSYEEVTEYNSRIYKDRFNEPDVVEGIDVEEIIKEVDVKKAEGGRIGYSKAGFVVDKTLKGLDYLKELFKKKPKKQETVKSFLEKRQFLKSMVGNTKANEKARELKMLKEAMENTKGYEFPSGQELRTDIEKTIGPILLKDRKLNATGGLANMIGE